MVNMNMLHLLLRILEKIIKESKNLFVSKDRMILRQRRLNLFKPTLPYFNIKMCRIKFSKTVS